MPIRSGPFSITVPTGGEETQRVVRGGLGSVYRFFNSTDRTDPQQKKFRLTNAAAAGGYVEVDQNLRATMSIDVAVGPTDDPAARPVGIQVIASNQVGTPEVIQGSFDLVRDRLGVRTAMPSRSGRFNFPRRVANNFLPVLLVDLTHSLLAAIYRFSNTGDLPFEVFIALDKEGASEVLREEIDAKQTLDLEIYHATVRRVWVARVNNGDHIRGVFELVG